MINTIRTATLACAVMATCGPAEAKGQWNGDLARLAYPADEAGGYWDEGYDFSFMLTCSPSNQALALSYSFINADPSPDRKPVHLRIGGQHFAIPWIRQDEEMGSVMGYYPAEEGGDRWPGQEALIQHLIDGQPLIVVEGDGIDDPEATQRAATGPSPEHPIFQGLSRACGSGDLTARAGVEIVPADLPDLLSRWSVEPRSPFWEGPTAFSPSDNDQAQLHVRCGADGQGEMALHVDEVPPPSDTNFGAAFVGHEVFEIVTGRRDGAYVFPVPPGLLAAMAKGRTVNFDSLIPVYETVDTIVTVNLGGAGAVLEQALSQCAATALAPVGD
ncbi:hypothetical protein [Antarctobacter sp.]|uniref:hypothetical protein n=1 Tax=Antarctobacter sp. TaxID=1872577 RepID=UPI002B274BA6|nr:hypothetical protein [Antarctobacter sp.]